MEKKITAELKEAQKRENRHIRRRFVGAGVMLVIALVLWQSGDEPPPPTQDFYAIPSAPEELIISAEEENITEVINGVIEENIPLEEGETFVSAVSVVEPVVIEEISEEENTENGVAEVIAEEIKEEEIKQIEKPTEEPSTVASNADLRLQAGAFNQKSNLDNLDKKLQAAGLATTMNEADGLFRLYIVGLADEAAQAAAKKVLNGLLQKGEEKRKVAVQVGAFTNHKNAEKIITELGKKGFEAWGKPSERGGKDVIVVRVGVADKSQTEATRLQLIKIGYEGAFVVNLE